MKKIATILLTFTIFCTAVYAQNEKDFKINSDGTITGYEGWDTAIVIPAQIGGITVTGINESAFKNMGLISVTLPVGIKHIGKEAFAINNITTVTIPSGVEIAEQAFSYNKLTSITIGNDVFINSINAFEKNNIKNIVLGMNVYFIRDTFNKYLYYEYLCNSRKAGTYDNSITYDIKREREYNFIVTKYGVVIINYFGNEGNRLIIPNQLSGTIVKGIGEGAFAEKNVSRMQLPDSIVYIDYDAFIKNRLTSVTIPDSVLFIGNSAFRENQLTSVTIGKNVNFIGNSAFRDNQLTSVTIPDKITEIWNSAFRDNQLTSVTIPDNITYIGGSAFRSNQLENITIGKALLPLKILYFLTIN